MFKFFKKALSVTLSVTLLMSTILVGGMFSFSASAATDLSGTKMPVTYTFDFEQGSINDYDNPEIGEAYKDVAGTDKVEILYGTSVDQFGNTFYPLRTLWNQDAHAIQKDIAVTTVDGGSATRGTLEIDNTAADYLMYIPTDAEGYPYLIEPNTNYKVTLKVFFQQGDGTASVFVGGGAIHPTSPRIFTRGVYGLYDGTAGVINPSVCQAMVPIYRAHYQIPTTSDSDGSHVFHAGTMVVGDSDAEASGQSDYQKGTHASGAFGAHWSPIDTTTFTESKADSATYRTMTLPMSTGDFTLDDNGQFVLSANDGSASDTFSPYLTIACFKNKSLFNIDSITIEKEVKVTLDANGGYFGEFDATAPTTTSVVKGFVGTAISATASHPDSSTKFVGWSLDGAIVDASAITAAMDGKTLKAVWADESLTYTFDFDSVPEITTTASTHGSYSTDQYGNQFHPATLYEGGEVATHTVSKETINYNGEDLSTLKVYSSSNREFRIIPVDENGKPYIVEPNTTYTVSVKYYNKQNKGYGGFFVGGGATNIAGHATTGNWCWLTSFTTRMTINGVVTNVTGKRPMFPAYSSSVHDTAWRDRDGSAEVSFETKTMTFSTEDFTATNGKFTYGSFSDTGAYFVLYMGPYTYWQNSTQDTSNKQGPYEYYFDYITITKSVSDVTVNLDANGGSFGDAATTSATLTPGEAIDVTAPTRRGAKLVGWSWYKNGDVVDTATTGMAGKTLYAVWAPLGTAAFNANGGYFGDYAEENATVTDFIYEGEVIADYAPKHPDSSAKLIGWDFEGEVIAADAVVTADMVGKTLTALWTEEDLTYTFDFDTYNNYQAQNKDVIASESGKSKDQNGKDFYPVMGNDGHEYAVTGENIVVKGQNVSVVKLTEKYTASNAMVMRFIPTDENGYPYITKPGTKYKISVTYATQNFAYGYNMNVGSGAINPFTGNIGTSNFRWLVNFPITYTADDGNVYPTEGEPNPIKSFDEFGYVPHSTAVPIAQDAAASDKPIDDLEFVTESRIINTNDVTLTDGKYTFSFNSSTWDVAPYVVITLNRNGGTSVPNGTENRIYIDSITVTELKDDVTVNFDANGGTLDTTSATLTPGSFIEVKPTHSDDSYQFKGWSWYKDTFVQATKVTTGMDGATLYAFYEQMVPVTFNANGGAINGKDAVTNYYNDGDTITAPTPERKYYTFKGWAAAADSNEIVEVPATATFDLAGNTYYAVWEVALHGEYDTYTRVVDYSSFNSGCFGNIASNACNTWVANDNYSYPWQSVGTDAAAGSADGYYLHYKSPQVINGTEYVPAGWAPHYSLIMTESGTHTNSGDMNDPTNLYLPENTTFRVTIRMKTIVLDAGSLNLRVGYGKNYSHSSFTNILTGIGEMEDWTNVTAVFTTPASYTEGSEKCILNLVPATTGTTLEYMIDSITLEKVTATTLYTVDNGVATEAKTVYGVPGTDLVLPTEVSTENYAANGTATVSRTPVTGWYADSALAAAAVTKFANINTAIYGSVEGDTTTTSAINQDLYCGFDSYAKAGSAATFITDEEAYTGNFSAKANKLTDIEVRNTNDLAIKAGKTYKVSFSYKSFGDAAVTVGLTDGTSFIEEKALGLALSNEWTDASAVFTADKGIEDGFMLVLRAKGVYIDNVVVSSVADSVGVVTEDGSNLRFLMTYNLTGDKIVIEGEEFTITKRGILVKGEESAEDILDFARTENFADCWNYDEATGKLIFSANMKIAENFGSKLVARGYVTLNDGTTYYSDYVTVGLDDAVSVDDVVADAVANNSYVYLPEGTVLAAEAASAATFYNLFVSGEVVVNDVLENNTMKFGAYAKFSAAPEAGAVVVPDEAKYLVHAGAYEDLCAGVDAHVATYKLDQVGEDAVNYIFITDLHFDNNNAEVTKQMQLITNMANNDDSIDMVVVGGDITTGMFTTKEEAIAATQTAIAPLKDCTKPVIVLRGNHDDNTYGGTFDRNNPASTIVSDLDWNNDIIKYFNDESVYSNFVHSSVLPNSAYYYYDIEKNGKTTRVIALNACDQDLSYDEDGNIASIPVSVRSWEITDGLLTEGRNVTYGAGVSMYGYSSRQMKWLAEEALAGFDGDIIVLSHMATDGHGQGNAAVTPVKNSEALNKILNAYQTKGTYNGTLYDELADVYNLETREYTARAGVAVSADFSATDGKILIYQYGHTHIEMVTYFATANFWEINTATANYANAPKDYDAELNSMNQNYPWNIATKDERTENSDTACFDVVSAGSNVVYKFNVGFGNDVTMVVSR